MNTEALILRKEPSLLTLFLRLSLPVMISQSTQKIILFFDLLFLSWYRSGQGELLINSSLAGGLTSFVTLSFFVITVSYSNAICAQYLGAKKQYMCGMVGSQVFFLTLLFYPIVLILSYFVGDFFSFFGHSQEQRALETLYARILLVYGGIPFILNGGLSGVFIGLGKTKVVMISNLIAMVVNIPLNYALIFGVGILPELGLPGAAYASVISAFIGVAILLAVYLSNTLNRDYMTRVIKWNWNIGKKLITFGTPSAVDVFLGTMVFNFFILVMNSYGTTVGAAVTIAINWDSTFFMPMVGVSAATTSLFGRYIGEGDLAKSQRVAKISYMVMASYALILGMCFLMFAPSMVRIFTSQMNHTPEVTALAVLFVRLASVYLFADAANLTFSGALRGAGDTRAAMCIVIIIYLIFGTAIYYFAFIKKIDPLQVWLIFILFAFMLGLGLFLRYLTGKWKKITLIK